MIDHTFERYISLQDLGEAWRELDAHSLMDGAIELSHAEQRYLRQHELGITSTELLALALEVAKQLQQMDALERLMAVTTKLNVDSLSDKITSTVNTLNDTSNPFSAISTNPATLLGVLSASADLSESAQQVAATAQLLDRISLTHAIVAERVDLMEIVYVDLEGPTGNFTVRANDHFGVRAKNNPYSVRRFHFHVSGRWSYGGDNFFDYKGNPDRQAPAYSSGVNYWLPGANIGALLAWGGRVATIEALEAKDNKVQLNPGGQVMFIMNDNSARRNGRHLFTDNVGELSLRWEEIDIIIT